jgi:hypothetical protein
VSVLTLEDKGDPGKGEGEEGFDAEEVGRVDDLEDHLVMEGVDVIHVLFFFCVWVCGCEKRESG